MYHLLAATLIAAIGSSRGAAPTKPACTTDHEQARLVQAMPAEYPFIAEMEGVTGRVFARVELSNTGHVQNTYVAKSSGNLLLDQAAIAAVSSSAYAPEFIGCAAISGSYVIEVDFDV